MSDRLTPDFAVVNLGIAGSRDYPLLDLVADYVSMLPTNIRVVSGGARGVDKVAEDAAWEAGLPEPLIILPEYHKYDPKVAPRMRNYTIVKQSYRVTMFWNMVSPGTLHTLSLCRFWFRPYILFGPAGEILEEVHDPCLLRDILRASKFKSVGV